jgi:stress response protein YsnF
VATERITVQDASGRRTEAVLVDREADGSVRLQRADGRVLHVPAQGIARHEGDVLHLTARLDDGEPDTEVIPLVEEQLVVEKRVQPGATVEVHTRTQVREAEVDEVVTVETVDVKRVPIARYVDTPASIRKEGNTTIVPVHEEVLVVEKRLLLKEEWHVTKHTHERRETKRVSLRSQSADVARTEPEDT